MFSYEDYIQLKDSILYTFLSLLYQKYHIIFIIFYISFFHYYIYYYNYFDTLVLLGNSPGIIMEIRLLQPKRPYIISLSTYLYEIVVVIIPSYLQISILVSSNFCIITSTFPFLIQIYFNITYVPILQDQDSINITSLQHKFL